MLHHIYTLSILGGYCYITFTLFRYFVVTVTLHLHYFDTLRLLFSPSTPYVLHHIYTLSILCGYCSHLQYQEVYKLTVMDLLFASGQILIVDYLRGLFVRYCNKCWCWDMETSFVSIPNNIRSNHGERMGYHQPTNVWWVCVFVTIPEFCRVLQIQLSLILLQNQNTVA